MNSQAISAEMDEATESLRWLTEPLEHVDDFKLDSQIRIVTEMLDDLEDPIIHMDIEVERGLLSQRLYDLEMELLDREQKRMADRRLAHIASRENAKS